MKTRITLEFFILSLIAILSISLASCSQSNDPTPAKGEYKITVSENATISTGTYKGQYIGMTDTVSNYLTATEAVTAGTSISRTVPKGQTLLVKIEGDIMNLRVTRDGAEVLNVQRSKDELYFLFYNK